MQWAAQDDTSVPMVATGATQSVVSCADCTPYQDDLWTDDEDAFLKRAISVYTNNNYEMIAETLGRSSESVRHRMHIISDKMDSASSGYYEMAAMRHHNLISSILSSASSTHPSPQPNTTTSTSQHQQRTRPIQTASQASKKLQSAAATVHPSHEAAVRKANQNINKLLTPGELALRRLQRNRVMTGEITSGSGNGNGSGSGGQPALQPLPQPTPPVEPQSTASSTVPSNPPSPKK